MQYTPYPVIDPVATGKNIARLRQERGLSVRDLQAFFGFDEPQAIYKWQRGKSLPSVDNLYALGALLNVPLDRILVAARPTRNTNTIAQQADACCASLYFEAEDIGGGPCACRDLVSRRGAALTATLPAARYGAPSAEPRMPSAERRNALIPT